MTAPFVQLVKSDVRRLHGHSSVPGLVRWVLSSPGFTATLLYRVQQALSASAPLRPLARVVSSANYYLTGAEFVPGCVIGEGLVVRHAAGVVIGTGVVAGANLTLLHNVTVGESLSAPSDSGRYPTIGDSVTIGTGSVVIGDVHVGDGATVGALSLVNRSVDEGSTVAGAPARRLPSGEPPERRDQLDRPG